MLGPTAALICVAWMTPACCCGPQPPAPGPPGNISGQVQFPAGTDPAPVAVYAVNVDRERPDAVPYLVTYLEPPATNYQIEAPPGDYQVVARFDTDPLSVGGYITCSTAACTPNLTVLRLNTGRNMSGVDIAGWGSRHAAQLLLHIDLFGLPIPSPELSSPSQTVQDTTPTPSPLPVRERPHGPTPALPAPHEFPSYYFQSSHLTIRVDLPSDWHEIQEPLPSPTDTTYYFVNEDVQSPHEP